MTGSKRSLRSLAGLLACYAVAGFCWWSTLGCPDLNPLEPEILVAGTGATPTTTTRCLGLTGNEIECFDRDNDTDVIACLSLPPASGADWGDNCECQDPPDDEACALPDSCEMDLTGNFFPECTVSYCPLSEPLSVTASGAGRVTSDPPGIDCSGTTCSNPFCDGAVVTLTATAREGSGTFFDGWTGHQDCAAVGNVTSVTLDAARQCTATFRQPVVQVSVLGSGKVVGSVPGIESCRSSSPASECAASAPVGSSVTLNAFADPGANFLGWGGDCADVASQSATLVVDDDKTCNASFTSVPGGGGVGVIEIVSLEDDESLSPDGIADVIGFDANDDLQKVSFAGPAYDTLLRDRVLRTTRPIRPPETSLFVAHRPVSLSADGRAVAYTILEGFAVREFAAVDQSYWRALDADPLDPPVLLSLFDPARGIGGREFGGFASPSLSGSGRFVAYGTLIPSFRDDPTLQQAGQAYGVAVYDTCLGAPPAEACSAGPVAISYDATTAEANFHPNGDGPFISRDGRFVLYQGVSSSPPFYELLLHDRDRDDDGVFDEPGATGTDPVLPGLADYRNTGIRPDASGRYVTFRSTDPSLPGNADPPPSGRHFLRDTCAGVPLAQGCVPSYQLLSVQADGQPDYQPSTFQGSQVQFDFDTRLTHVSASGRYVVLESEDRRLFQVTSNPSTWAGRQSVVRDTCVGAPPGCTPTNRLIARRLDGGILFAGQPGRVSDDGTLAVMIGQRSLTSSPGVDSPPEVLLATTGVPLETGGVPRITATHPVKAVSPQTAAKGSGAFLITIRGEGFVPGATVTWNGEPRRTIFVSSGKLQAWVTDFDIDPPVTPVVRFLRVVNPGGGTSTPQVSFTITASVAAVCGDGTKANSEACDDGNTIAGDGCSGSCAVEAGYSCPFAFPCRSICGDGLVVTGEECDPGVLGGPACTAVCTLEEVIPVCGDGVVTPPEECDPAEVGGPACTEDCTLDLGVSIIGAVVTPPLPPGVAAHFAGVTQFMEVEVSQPAISLELTCTNSGGVCQDTFDVSPPLGTPPVAQVVLPFFLAADSYQFGLVAHLDAESSPLTLVTYDRTPALGEVKCEFWTDGAPGAAEQRRLGFRLVRPSSVAIGNGDYFVYQYDGIQTGWRELSTQLGVGSAQLVGDATTLSSFASYQAVAVDRETTPATAEAAREFLWGETPAGPTRGCTFCSRGVGGSCQIIPLQ